jgi:hypothetical protein
MFCRDRDTAALVICKRTDTSDEEWIFLGQKLSDADITRIVEERWSTPLKITLPARPLDYAQPIFFTQILVDGVEEDELTLVHFTDYRSEPEDLDDDNKAVTHIVASPHTVNLVLPKNATIERTIEVFQSQTGMDWKWEGRITSEGCRRVAELRPTIAPSVTAGSAKNLDEVRIFFGKPEFKHVFEQDASDNDWRKE